MTDTFYTSVDNKSHVFIRTESRFFDIADFVALTDGRVPNRDGVLPDAIQYSDEEVADLLTEVDERQRHLENIESLLEEWISIRRSRSGKAKQRLHQLQKQEVSK